MSKDVFSDDQFDSYQQYKKKLVLPSNPDEKDKEEEEAEESIIEKAPVVEPKVIAQEQPEEKPTTEPIDLKEESDITQSSTANTIGMEAFGYVEEDNGERIKEEDLKKTKSTTRGNEKKSFKDVQGENYSPPKLNKTILLVIVLSFIVGFVVLFNIATTHRKKQLAEENAQRDVTTEYSPTFGDYKARAYKEDEKIQEEIKTMKDTTTAKPTFKEPPRYSQAPAPVRAAPVSTISQSEEEAIKSPLQKNVSGFGRPSSMKGSSGDIINPLNAEELMKYSPMQLAGQATGNTMGMSKQQYTDQRLSDISSLLGATGAATPAKNDNVNNGRFSQNGAYNPANTSGGKITALDDATLFPGTIIHAVLVSGINTDYPAPITARVIENVYDSKTGLNLLIPQGSILQGDYSSSSIGIGKVQIAWTGLTISFDNLAYYITLGGMAGVDQQGNAGIKGTIDDHYWQWLKAAGIMSMFTVLNSEIAYQTKNIQNEGMKELLDENQSIVNKIGNKLVDRALDIQPTVIVKNGTRVSVSVNTAVQMVPLNTIPPVQRYER